MPPGRSELIDSSCLHRLLLWPLQASRMTSTWTRDKCRDIPCGSPPEDDQDDQVVRRCLLTISAFCSRLRGVCSSCSFPCSAPSAPFRCASDVVLAGYARMVHWYDYVGKLSARSPRFWCSCVCPLVEYRKLESVSLSSITLGSKVVASLFY